MSQNQITTNASAATTVQKISDTERVSVNPTATFGPEFRFHNSDARPYWKSYGTGTARLSVEKMKYSKGAIHIKVTNTPEGGRGEKEAWIELPPKAVEALLKFLAYKFD